MHPLPPLPWLDHLEAHLPVAREGADPEGVHQVRVALARLDLWLRMGGWRVLRPDVRWLRRSASRVRDLEVQLHEAALPADIRAHLESELHHARVELVPALESPRAVGVLLGLRSLPPLRRADARRHARRLERLARRRGAALLDDPEDLERFHDLRRAVRRLRYAREWLGEDAKPVKRVQDALGELNDQAVLVGLLARVPSSNGALVLRREREAEIARLRDVCLRKWRDSELAGRSR